MKLQFAPYVLRFKSPAGTSRGILTEKITAFLKLFDEDNPEVYGIGEAAIFPGLSPEADERYFYKMTELVTNVKLGIPTDLSRFPSIQAGFEQAILDFSNGSQGIYFNTPFVKGEKSIAINGLIWMDDYSAMKRQVETKLKAGFRCIKIKIGAIDWQKELDLLSFIRSYGSEDDIQIRVDANGAFTEENVFSRLDSLSKFRIHSIEQPVRQGQMELMAKVCKSSPVPVALDEELIGKFTQDDKEETLSKIQPQYIILKPSLIGGFSGAHEWIQIAGDQGIGWWVTSALESNIGLNAIAQWVATLDTSQPQGLGTGGLFTNNLISPVFLNTDRLCYDPEVSIDRHQINSLDWRD